jgi:hypothetical protein
MFSKDRTFFVLSPMKERESGEVLCEVKEEGRKVL